MKLNYIFCNKLAVSYTRFSSMFLGKKLDGHPLIKNYQRFTRVNTGGKHVTLAGSTTM